MNTGLVTTGLLPLTIGSTELFELQAFANDLPWDLTGGSVQLRMTDSNGGTYLYAATISGMIAQVSWTVVGPEGTWLRAWRVQDASGIIQVSRPIVFDVLSSPS